MIASTRAALACHLVLLLAACGGGSGPVTVPPADPPPPPVAPDAYLVHTPRPSGSVGGYATSVGVRGDGSFLVGGYAAFEDDVGVVVARPLLEGFRASGAFTGLVLLGVEQGGAEEGRSLCGDPNGTFVAGTIRSPAANTALPEGEAAVWRMAGTGADLLGSAEPKNGYSAAIRGTNRAGDLVGTDQACRPIYRAAGDTSWTFLPRPQLAGATPRGAAFDIADSGTIVGSSGRPGLSLHAVVWRTPVASSWLPVPHDAVESHAFCVSSDGRFIGGTLVSEEGGHTACRWTWSEGTSVYLVEPLPVDGAVLFVSDRGVCYGGRGSFVLGDQFRAEEGSGDAWVCASPDAEARSMRDVFADEGVALGLLGSLDAVVGGTEWGGYVFLVGSGVGSQSHLPLGWVARLPSDSLGP